MPFLSWEFLTSLGLLIKLNNIFFRYLDPRNNNEPFSPSAAQNMPVDLYIGEQRNLYK